MCPPIDIQTLARHYAKVEMCQFPFELDIDGVCLNLKKDNMAEIIINEAKGTRQRRRFTLAHELGHVLIPWHVGSLADDFEENASYLDEEKKKMEAEADRFAAELLMPTDWVNSIQYDSPQQLVRQVKEKADVSFQAAFLKVKNILPSGFVFAVIENGIVSESGRSPGTLASALRKGSTFDPQNDLAWSKEAWAETIGSRLHFWWNTRTTFTPEMLSETDDWRSILNKIVESFIFDTVQANKFKQSVNGVAASINARHRNGKDLLALFEDCCQRMHSRAQYETDYALFVKHNDFLRFVTSRMSSFIKNKPSQ